SFPAPSQPPPTPPPFPYTTLFRSVALLMPAGVGALAGSRAALWSSLVGGLLVFIVWVSATYLRDGGPYDAGLLRDFDRSGARDQDRKSTRLNSSHVAISYAVFCLK